jgi:flagellar biosynthetic protein FliQ
MDSQLVVDLVRDAMVVSLLIGAPMLVAGLLVGLAVGLLQALTQVQEQTVAFLPKLLVTVLAFVVALPWMLAKLIDYVQNLFASIPENL